MKAIFKRDQLSKSLTVAAAFTPGRGARPILRDALLTVRADGSCDIQATDLEVGVRCNLEAESVDEAWRLCVPATMLAGLLKEYAEEHVELTVSEAGTRGTLTSGRDVFEIFCRKPDDFPEVPGEADGEALNVPAARLAKALELTLVAAAREMGRYAINGIHLRGRGERLDVVATDGRRLAVVRLSVAGLPAIFADPDRDIVLPIKLAQETLRLCSAAGSAAAKLALTDRTFRVTVGGATMSGLLIQGTFPKYETVVPKDCDQRIHFQREVMLHALAKSSFVESEDTHAIRLEFTQARCRLLCCDVDKGGAEISVDVDYAGPEISIQFNSRYLADALKVLDEDCVALLLHDGARPGIIKPVVRGPSPLDFTYVLMPIKQQD